MYERIYNNHSCSFHVSIIGVQSSNRHTKNLALMDADDVYMWVHVNTKLLPHQYFLMLHLRIHIYTCMSIYLLQTGQSCIKAANFIMAAHSYCIIYTYISLQTGLAVWIKAYVHNLDYLQATYICTLYIRPTYLYTLVSHVASVTYSSIFSLGALHTLYIHI